MLRGFNETSNYAPTGLTHLMIEGLPIEGCFLMDRYDASIPFGLLTSDKICASAVGTSQLTSHIRPPY